MHNITLSHLSNVSRISAAMAKDDSCKAQVITLRRRSWHHNLLALLVSPW